jgi:L-fuconolactonase
MAGASTTSGVVVDAAVHVWCAEDPADPWPPGSSTAAARHGAPLSGDAVVAEMDVAGVDRCVVFPPFFVGHRNRYAIAEASAHDDRMRVMVRPDLRHERARDHVLAMLAEPVVAGARFVFSAASGITLDDRDAEWFWRFAEEIDVPVMLLAPNQHDVVRSIATAHPRLRIALDHLNLSGAMRDGGIAAEIDALVALSGLDNVSVKVSAMPCYSDAEHPYAPLHHHIERVIDAFGADRVFWGSDLSRLHGTYADCVAMFTDEMPFIDGHDLTSIMGGALLRWLRWTD